MEILQETPEKRYLALRDESVRNKIRTLYMDGKSIQEISIILEIPTGTMDSAYWRNTHGIRDFFNSLKNERLLRRIEAESEKILDIDGEENAKMLAIKQKEMEFLRETKLKEFGYTKRSEVIGFNLNKTEPLDDAQRSKLDTLLGKDKTQDTIKEVERQD